MSTKTFDLIQKFEQLSCIDAIEKEFYKFINKIGLDSFFYISNITFDLKFRTASDVFPVSYFSSGFLSNYTENNWGVRDPVYEFCRQFNRPLLWPQLVSNNQKNEFQANDVVLAAKDFGIESGFSIPMNENGSHNGITFSSDRPKEFIKTVIENYDLLVSATYTLHNYLKNQSSRIYQELLSAKQLDCLKWLAEGKSSKQIGQLMQIQEDTVNKHIQAIKLKLDASNRIEAVVKAIKLQILDL